MRRAWISGLALVLWGCHTYVPYDATVPTGTKRVETQPLPPTPWEEPLPEGLPDEDWVIPFEAGSCLDSDGAPVAIGICPNTSGIAVSEARAYRDGLCVVRYRELRELFESDRKVWTTHRELYEERLKLADRAIQDLKPSWWDRSKFQIGIAGGIITGIATTIAIVAITDEGN